MLFAKGGAYVYFLSGEAAEWLDRAVPKLIGLTLEEWIDQLLRLKKLNQEIMRAGRAKRIMRHPRAPSA